MTEKFSLSMSNVTHLRLQYTWKLKENILLTYHLKFYVSIQLQYLRLKNSYSSDLTLLCLKVTRSMQMTHFFSSLWLIFHCTHMRTHIHVYIYIYTHTNTPHFLYPFFCWRIFRLLAHPGFVNSAAMNVGIHVSFAVLVFSRYVLRSGTAGSHGISVLNF